MNASNETCVPDRDLTYIVYQSVYVSLVSSLLAIFGSFLIILTFILWQDVRRSMARIVLLFLAIADMGSGLGYFASSVGYLAIYESHNGTVNYSISVLSSYCTGVSFITTFFPVSSFFWTSFLAIYFVIALVLRKPRWSKRLLIIFNIIAWGVPLVICTVAVALKRLGSSQSRTTGAWCFVSMKNISSYSDFLGAEAGIAKGWELLSYVVVIVCYAVIIVVNKRWFPYRKTVVLQNAHPPLLPEPDDQNHLSSVDPKQSLDYVRIATAPDASYSVSQKAIVNQAVSKVDWKLLVIPIVFVVLRLPGTYRYILSMTDACNPDYSNCSGLSQECFSLVGNYIPFLFFHSFCDPLQGFGNAVLFVFLSKPILFRLLRCVCFRGIITKMQRKMESIKQTKTHSENPNKLEYRVKYSPSLSARKSETDEDNNGQFHGSLLNSSVSAKIEGYGTIRKSSSITSINAQ